MALRGIVDWRLIDVKYVVMVDDNFHFMDESERYKAGEFDTYEQAEALCREIIRKSFQELGGSFEAWKNYGDSPFIVGGKFIASSYAEKLSQRLNFG